MSVDPFLTAQVVAKLDDLPQLLLSETCLEDAVDDAISLGTLVPLILVDDPLVEIRSGDLVVTAASAPDKHEEDDGRSRSTAHGGRA